MTRRIENSIEVPGTPEQVWEAIATEPRHRVLVRAGAGRGRAGRARHGRRDGGRGPVIASEPPRRFVYEEDWEAVEGEPPGRLASEFLVEAKAGGTCVVRLVSTLHADGEGWDEVLDSMYKGWETFLLNLRAYLTHFPGQRCATVMASGTGDWPAFLDALGLAGADVGDRVRTANAPDARGHRRVPRRARAAAAAGRARARPRAGLRLRLAGHDARRSSTSTCSRIRPTSPRARRRRGATGWRYPRPGE